MTNTYNIYRHYAKPEMQSRLIKTGLTLKQAQAHCNDPETSSQTAKKGTMGCVSDWIDGYTNKY